MIRSTLATVFLSLLVISGFLPVTPVVADEAGLEIVPGQVLVCLEEGVDPDVLESNNGRSDLAELLIFHGLDRLFPLGADRGGRFFLLESSRADLDPVRAARQLMATAAVSSAAPNYLRPLLVVPDDPYFGDQWYLQPGNAAGVALDDAWEMATGSPATTIAIIDTGVDLGHPDLSANIWNNPGETPGNGVDDDGNGFIDDHVGWDFGQNDNDPNPHVTPDAVGFDVGFHGTHCAGIAAASTDNGLGVAGAAWNCQIMALKLPDSAGNMTDLAITGAVLYAIAEGADVISMSFGGPDQDGMAAFMQDLMDQALEAGVVCVAAAGNDNSPTLFYPAACEGVIAVGATDETGSRASFSSFGAWVDVAAPGNRIWSTLSQNYEFGLLDGLLYSFVNGWDTLNPYMYSDGTSMACPLVAGICGLILDQSPGLSPEEVLARLVSTGDEVVFDQPLGVKVNAARALDILSPAPLPMGGGLHLSGYPNPFNPSTVIRFRLAGAGEVTVQIHDAAGRRIRTLWGGPLAAGEQSLLFDGRNDGGRALPSGTYFATVRSAQGTDTIKLQLLK